MSGLLVQVARCVSLCLLLGIAGCAHRAQRPADSAIEKAIAQSYLEMKDLPAKVPADSIRLDAAGLQADWLVELFRRNVGLIEIAPRPLPNDPQLSLVAPASYGVKAWTMPVAAFMFVQLRLSRDGDPSCVHQSDLHYDLQGIRRMPFRPDTCLAVTISPKSQARFHLRHVAAHPWGPPFAKWELFDTKESVTLAALTTIDPADRPARTSAFNHRSGNAPYVNLAFLVDNSSGVATSAQIYQRRSVAASSPPPLASPQLPPNIPLVTGAWRANIYQQADFRAVFNRSFESAVDEADRTGWGHSREGLIDARQRALLQLEFPGERQGRRAFAADRGFYVMPAQWRRDHPIWLSRYSAAGQLQWTVGVSTPDMPADRPNCGDATVETDADSIVLVSPCLADTRADTRYSPIPVRRIEISRRDIETAVSRRTH